MARKRQKNNPKTALNVLYVKKYIRSTFIHETLTLIMKTKSHF